MVTVGETDNQVTGDKLELLLLVVYSAAAPRAVGRCSSSSSSVSHWYVYR